MATSPEQPPIGDDPEITSEERTEIGRKWYSDTSFEGRSGAEFKALREELRKTSALDFARYRSDQDYERLIHENEHVREFETNITKYALLKIYDERKDIGLSDEQFDKMLSTFDESVQKGVRTFFADGKMARALYKLFSPEELEGHTQENLRAMKREIELQEQNIPHEPLTKLPPFPQKRGKQK